MASATSSATAARQSPWEDSAEQKIGCAELRRVVRGAVDLRWLRWLRRKAWNKGRLAARAKPPRDVLKKKGSEMRCGRCLWMSPRFFMVKSYFLMVENHRKGENLGWMESDNWLFVLFRHQTLGFHPISDVVNPFIVIPVQ